MAEALAVVGAIASIVQLADFSSKILRRLDEFHTSEGEIPKSFRDIKTELTVLHDTLRQTKEVIDSGLVGDGIQKALWSAVQGCQEQIARLDAILAKAIPEPNDSSFRIARKAVASLSYETSVVSITKNLQRYSQSLAFNQAAASLAESGTTLDLTTSNRKIKETVSASLNEDAEDLRRRCNDLGAQVYQQSLRFERAQTDSNIHPQSHVCYILAIVVFLVFSTSLALALWWSISHHDVSGGFTMGAYIIATAGMPIGVVGYRHSHNCRCWVKSQDGQCMFEIQLLANSSRTGGANDRDENEGFRAAS